MNSLALNRFSTSIPTVRISDIMKTDLSLTKGLNGDTKSQANTELIAKLVIGRDYFHDGKCHLVIDNYPNLEKICIILLYNNKFISIE